MIYEIEKNFGTSLLLYISGMRANNNPVMKAAKKCFSPLFHVNQNPIYSQLDIHSDNMLMDDGGELSWASKNYTRER